MHTCPLIVYKRSHMVEGDSQTHSLLLQGPPPTPTRLGVRGTVAYSGDPDTLRNGASDTPLA